MHGTRVWLMHKYENPHWLKFTELLYRNPQTVTEAMQQLWHLLSFTPDFWQPQNNPWLWALLSSMGAMWVGYLGDRLTAHCSRCENHAEIDLACSTSARALVCGVLSSSALATTYFWPRPRCRPPRRELICIPLSTNWIILTNVRLPCNISPT